MRIAAVLFLFVDCILSPRIFDLDEMDRARPLPFFVPAFFLIPVAVHFALGRKRRRRWAWNCCGTIAAWAAYTLNHFLHV